VLCCGRRGRKLRTLGGITKRIDAIAFSPNGQLFASARLDGNIAFWDVASGNLMRNFSV
jgi:WD40 repeat protein